MSITTEQLDAMLAAANARADHARDDALVEAAARFPDGRQPRPPHAIRGSILALRDKPAPAVTVREAARVLLDQPYGVMSVAFDAIEKLHGEGADHIMAAALRAIAGGGDE